MELDIVNRLLQDVALDHSASKPYQATQNIALALMHIAASVDQIEKQVAALRARLPPP
jgi:hypothetical protein